jgi:hypothetical protein
MDIVSADFADAANVQLCFSHCASLLLVNPTANEMLGSL